MESQNTPWEAIAARLKDEANNEQLLQIKGWLDCSPENSVIFSEIINFWSLTKHKTQFYEPNKTINWQKLMKRIGHSQSHIFQLNTYFKWLAAAAVLVIVFLMGLSLGNGFLKRSTKVSLVRIVAPEGSKTQIFLPDSTQVWLNSGAELQYPGDFSVQNRRITMKGECFFSVTKDQEHPFFVVGTKLRIKFYGTQFNINENGFIDGTEVTLISGKVEVYDKSNQLLSKLNPGEQLVYKNGLSQVQKTVNPEALTSWINNMLIFNNRPFEEVIYYLEKWYGVNITLDRTTNYDYNYTFKVKTESLREVLSLISFITPIVYRIEGENVTIKYKKNMKK